MDSRSWFFWMPDQVRHDGELWIVEIVILVEHFACHSERSEESQTGGVFSFRNGRYGLRTCHSERSEESQSSQHIGKYLLSVINPFRVAPSE